MTGRKGFYIILNTKSSQNNRLPVNFGLRGKEGKCMESTSYIEHILDFAVSIGARMLYAGANLERVDDTMRRICQSYQLKAVSIYSLSDMIMLSAKTQDDVYASRQVTVPPASIHLKKLDQYNQLSRKVCIETPQPETLAGLLEEIEKIKEYSMAQVILGYQIAMTSLCVIFAGNLRDVIAVNISTFMLFWVIRWLTKPNLNQIIVNTLSMGMAGALASVLVKIGIGEHFFTIIIVNSMMLIPGIPMVNAVRNILCGNEMNGILQIFKVMLETIAIVLGLILSMYMFGGRIQW